MGILYDHLIAKHKRRVSFVVLVSFLLTFVIVRLYVLSATAGIIDDPYLYIRGYHIHHLNYGIFIMALAGFCALVLPHDKDRLKVGMLYGVGLGLTFDEFGMWLRLQDDYWSRLSYDAVIVISLIFINIVYFYPIWERIRRRCERGFRRVCGRI